VHSLRIAGMLKVAPARSGEGADRSSVISGFRIGRKLGLFSLLPAPQVCVLVHFVPGSGLEPESRLACKLLGQVPG
jgi:hypothetical protein